MQKLLTSFLFNSFSFPPSTFSFFLSLPFFFFLVGLPVNASLKFKHSHRIGKVSLKWFGFNSETFKILNKVWHTFNFKSKQKLLEKIITMRNLYNNK